MGRIQLALIIGGGFLGFFGIQEFRVGMGTANEPVAVALKDLEDGEALPNNFIVLDEHFASHHETVYYYSKSKYDTSNPGTTTKISYSYHPVVSKAHPFAKKVDDYFKQLANNGGNISGVPEPKLQTFAVLVKTKKYKTIGDIPPPIVEPSVKGLVINTIDSLDGDERKLISQSFPSLDLDKVLILEEDREPASGLKSTGMILGGVLLIVAGIGWFFASKN